MSDLSEHFDGDELYGLILWERELARLLNTVHPSQFLFSTTEPGLSSRIGLLKQNYICLNNYLLDSPTLEHFKEIA